jgi:O-antigen/teichoic acid export membrane protein
LVLSLLAGLAVVAACLLLGYSSAVVWCVVIGATGLGLTTVATTLADLLQSLQRITILAAVNMTAGLALTGVSLVAAWRGAGPVAMAIAYVSGPAVSAALLLVIVRTRVCPVKVRWDTSSCRRLMTASRFFAAQQLLFAGSSQIEALLLPRLIGMNHFGVFSAGAMPANRLMAIPDGLSAAAYPTMVGACARGPSAGAALVRRWALLGASGGGLIAIAGTVVAEPIGRVLLPGHAPLFAMVVQITIWSLPLTALELVMGYALNACGKDAVQARLAAPSAAASLLCSVALVSGFGLTGACWSMVLRPAVRGAFLVPAVLRTFRSAVEARSDRELLSPTRPSVMLRKAG